MISIYRLLRAVDERMQFDTGLLDRPCDEQGGSGECRSPLSVIIPPMSHIPLSFCGVRHDRPASVL
jgi:hypothetical protein